MTSGGNASGPGETAIRFTFRPRLPGFLGGLFQTPLYHLRPVGVPSRRIQDFLGGSFQTRLYHLHPCRRVHK